MYIEKRLGEHLKKNLDILKHYISPIKSSTHIHQVFIYKDTNILYTEKSYLNVFKEFSIHNSLFDYFKINKKSIFYASTEIVIYVSLNGLVLILPNYQKVYKIINSKYEPNFTNHETKGRKIYGFKNTPEILNKSKVNGYHIIVYKFISRSDFLNQDQWTACFRKFISIQLKNSTFYFERSQDLIKKIYFEIDHMYENDHVGFCSKEMKKNLIFLISKYFIKNINIPKLFSHGDLTSNNIIRSRKNDYLIDFANGGDHVFVYDIMVIEFYKNNKSSIWKKFDKFDFNDSNETKFYFEEVLKIKETKFNNSEIRFFFLLSLIEFLIKNCNRYQSNDDNISGHKIVNQVFRITDLMIKSIAQR